MSVYDPGKWEQKEQVGKDRTSVHVHLDNTMLDGGIDLFLGRTGAPVENEEPEKMFEKIGHRGSSHAQGFLGCTTQLLADMLLVFTQEFRLKFNIARLINTVDVPESSSDTEVGANGAQS